MNRKKELQKKWLAQQEMAGNGIERNGLAERQEELCAKMSALLPELRNALGVSQTVLGEHTNVSRQTVSETERGGYRMSWNQFASFYLVFGGNKATHDILEENGLGIRDIAPVIQVSQEERRYQQSRHADCGQGRTPDELLGGV